MACFVTNFVTRLLEEDSRTYWIMSVWQYVEIWPFIHWLIEENQWLLNLIKSRGASTAGVCMPHWMAESYHHHHRHNTCAIRRQQWRENDSWKVSYQTWEGRNKKIKLGREKFSKECEIINTTWKYNPVLNWLIVLRKERKKGTAIAWKTDLLTEALRANLAKYHIWTEKWTLMSPVQRK